MKFLSSKQWYSNKKICKNDDLCNFNIAFYYF